MSTAASTPTDAVALVRDLDPQAIAARLAELEAEASALRVLLRAARARARGRRLRTPQTGPAGEEVRSAS